MIDLEGLYDQTAGNIITPVGTGKFVSYDPNTGKVIIEFDYEHIVELDGSECYPVEEA